MPMCRCFRTSGECKRNPNCIPHSLSPGEEETGVSQSLERPLLQLTSPSGTGGYYSPDHPFGTAAILRDIDTSFSTAKPPMPVVRRLVYFPAPAFSFILPFRMVAFTGLLDAVNFKNRYLGVKDVPKSIAIISLENGAKRVLYTITHRLLIPKTRNRSNISFATTYAGCLSHIITDFFINVTFYQRVRALYEILYANHESICHALAACMQEAVSARSISDPSCEPVSSSLLLNTLAMVLIGCLTLANSASQEHFPLVPSVERKLLGFNAKSGGFPNGRLSKTDHIKADSVVHPQHQISYLSSTTHRWPAAIARKDKHGSDGGKLGTLPHKLDESIRSFIQAPRHESTSPLFVENIMYLRDDLTLAQSTQVNCPRYIIIHHNFVWDPSYLFNGVHAPPRLSVEQSYLNTLGTFNIIGCITPGLVKTIQDDTQLRQISLNGRRLHPCESRLKCGHTCLLKYHVDDEEHQLVRCYESCRQVCSNGHPCEKECWVQCGNCDFLLPQLALECGHTIHNTPCHSRNDLSSYHCREQVGKRLPNCDHRAVMDCCRDPSEVHCQAVCNKPMTCCQQSCKSRCCECQQVSSVPRTRDQHKGHPCGRIMHCQHPCAQLCDANHKEVCGTEDCHQPCRQSCSHHTCTLGCSTPCTPCVMPCPWKCEHHECAVPCGSPCVRLPCDVRCSNVLSCGHSCPSLCGEPCEQQQCRQCASENDLSKVVDLIMHLTLADIDPSSTDLDNTTITLQCRHTFTVETLDGVCELSRAYERDAETNSWSQFLLSTETFAKTPCCPTCRAPITARRYSRLTKQGNLDLLERNGVTRMAREFGRLQAMFQAIDRATLEQSVIEKVAARPDLAISAEWFEVVRQKRDRFISDPDPSSVLPAGLMDRQMLSICGLPRTECSRWTSALRPLLELYQEVCVLLSQRTAHSMAYDASCSMLYERELKLARQGPHPREHPEAFAQQMAKTKVRMMPPRADTRFQVEAIWMSIDIRVLIASLGEKYFAALVEKSDASPAQIQAWAAYVTFIHESCARDAKLAIKVARTTTAYRQELPSGLCVFRAEWRKAQFSVIAKQAQPGGLGMVEGNSLASSMEEQLVTIMDEAQQLKQHCVSKGGILPSVVNEEFERPLDQCFTHWQDLIKTLKLPSVFYQPVSDEERRQIVGSFTEYNHRGHWYTCPNGHIFTINNCGGAVITSRCHECGEIIGGSRYQIVAGVAQAVELERIAASQGVGQSPWAWSANV